MRRFAVMTLGVAGVAIAVGLLGCGSAETPPADSPTTAADASTNGDGNGHEHGDSEHAHGGHDHASHGGHGTMADMEAGLAKLSEADRASAMKQHICPVTGDMLGTGGEPIKLTLKGQDIWVCCDDCKEPVEADPEKYLAKLNK